MSPQILVQTFCNECLEGRTTRQTGGKWDYIQEIDFKTCCLKSTLM